MASDNNGVDMMLVAMYSVIKNNFNYSVNFNIVHTDINDKNQARLRSLAGISSRVTVNLLLADKKMFEDVELTNNTVSMPAYYRYLAPSLLSREDRVLYMDIDMMCISDLGGLYETNLSKYHIGAIEDYFVSKTDDYPGFKKGIGFGSDDMYANSGLLLMNLSKMREDNIMPTFWDNIRRKADIIPAPYNIFADQTVMNITFKNKIKFLSNKYNVLTTALKYTKQKEVAIVHFAGPDKPFTYRDEYSAKYDDIYYDYYDECMAIVGGNGNLMIKNTIKRLGKETTEAITRKVEIEQLARDKASHVEELANELGDLNSKYEVLSAELNEVNDRLRAITSSFSWKITKPLRVLSRIKKVLKRG